MQSKEDSFIIHSGNDSIGGVAIQVVSGKIDEKGKRPSLFIDFGTRMDITGKFFGPFNQGDYLSGIKPLIELGIIPPLPDYFYREDLPNRPQLKDLEKSWGKSSTRSSDEIRMLKMRFDVQEDINATAIASTHYHWDHVGNIGFLRGDISLLATEITIQTIKAMEKHWGADWMREITAFRRRDLPKVGRKLQEDPRPLVIARYGKPLETSTGKILFYATSHSAVNSSAIDVELESGVRIHNTGDIREGEKTRQYIEWLDKTPPPDVFILDGTNISSDKISLTEKQVKDALLQKFRENKDTYFITVPQRQFERVNNILLAAKETGKKVYIPLIVAYYLHMLEPYRDQDERIPALADFSVYLQPKRSGKYDSKDYDTFLKEVLARNDVNVVKVDDLKCLEEGKSVVIFTSQEQMYCFYARGLFPQKGHYIHSTSEAFNEQGEVDLDKLQSLIREIGYDYEQLHASGHFSKDELAEFAKHIRSKVVIPLHTEYPEKFAEIIRRNSRVNPTVIDKISKGLPYGIKGNILLSPL